MFFITEMDDEGGRAVEVVPDIWINLETMKCAWPPAKNASRLIKSRKEPASSWKLYSARILGKYDSYNEAHTHLEKAEYTSDLSEHESSEIPQKRKRYPPRHLDYDGESDEDNLSPRTQMLPPRARPSGSISNARNNSKSKLGLVKSGSNTGAILTLLPPPPSVPEFTTVATAVVVSHNQDNVTTSNSFPALTEATLPLPLTGATKAFREVLISTNEETHLPLSNSVDMVDLGGSSKSSFNADNPTFKKLIADVASIKQYVINIDKKLEQLLQPKTSSHNLENLKKLPLPFTTVEYFVEFNNTLTVDMEKDLKTFFRLCGGSDTVEFIGRVMRKLFSEDVAAQYSLKGLKGNFNFQATRTFKVLKECTLSIRSYNTDEKKVEDALTSWFRHANERLKKKQAECKNKVPD